MHMENLCTSLLILLYTLNFSLKKVFNETGFNSVPASPCFTHSSHHGPVLYTSSFSGKKEKNQLPQCTGIESQLINSVSLGFNKSDTFILSLIYYLTCYLLAVFFFLPELFIIHIRTRLISESKWIVDNSPAPGSPKKMCCLS